MLNQYKYIINFMFTNRNKIHNHCGIYIIIIAVFLFESGCKQVAILKLLFGKFNS